MAKRITVQLDGTIIEESIPDPILEDETNLQALAEALASLDAEKLAALKLALGI